MTENDSKTFVFVGDKKVGKSSLIQKLLDLQTSQGEQLKETIALDFKFGDRKFDEHKIRLNTYEIGGGR